MDGWSPTICKNSRFQSPPEREEGKFMTTSIATLPITTAVADSGAHAVLPPLDYDSTVDLLEITRMAFDSLFANKVRSLLTMLGVIIGVASVIALLALGNGASAAITG